MKYLVGVIMAIMGAAHAFITLDKEKSGKSVVLGKNADKEAPSIHIGKRKKIVFCGICFLITGLSVLHILQNLTVKINIIKMFVILLCLIGSACIDYRERRIPNFFPLVLSLSGIILLGIGYCTGQNGAMGYIVSSVFSTAVCAVCLIITSLLTKQGIGIGDIKLLCSVAIIGGVEVISGTVFWAVLISAATALALLLAKKKKLSGSLPFAPFIFAGYVLTIFLKF